MRGRNFFVLAILALTACSHVSQSAWAYTPPPATPVVEPTSTVQRSVNRPLRSLSPAAKVLILSPRWSQSVADRVENFSRSAILGVNGGVIFASGQAVAFVNDDGTKRWVRPNLGPPIGAYGRMLFATAPRGLIALDAATATTLWKRGDCDAQWARWIVPFSSGVMHGCAEQSTGDATLTTYSFSGKTLASGTFYGGALDGDLAVRIDDTHAWLLGGFSGAWTGAGAAIARLPSSTTTDMLKDITFAGNDRPVKYVTDDIPMFGRQDTYEPVHLERLGMLTGEVSGPVVYAPDAQLLADRHRGEVGQGYVYDGHHSLWRFQPYGRFLRWTDSDAVAIYDLADHSLQRVPPCGMPLDALKSNGTLFELCERRGSKTITTTLYAFRR